MDTCQPRDGVVVSEPVHAPTGQIVFDFRVQLPSDEAIEHGGALSMVSIDDEDSRFRTGKGAGSALLSGMGMKRAVRLT